MNWTAVNGGEQGAAFVSISVSLKSHECELGWNMKAERWRDFTASYTMMSNEIRNVTVNMHLKIKSFLPNP